MSGKKQLHLGAFMRPTSLDPGAWGFPGAWPDSNFNFPRMKTLIRRLEAAKFDAFFMADHMAVLNMSMDALKRSHTTTSFEPFTLLSALAASAQSGSVSSPRRRPHSMRRSTSRGGSPRSTT